MSRRVLTVVVLALLGLGLVGCVPSPPPPDPPSGCLDSTVEGSFDIEIVGPVGLWDEFEPGTDINEFPAPYFYKNTRLWTSTDGSCTIDPEVGGLPGWVLNDGNFPHATIVVAPDATRALVMCNYGGSGPDSDPSTSYSSAPVPLSGAYDVPAGTHLCSPEGFTTLRPGNCYSPTGIPGPVIPPFRFDGPRNTVGNLTVFVDSGDVFCAGANVPGVYTAIQAPNLSAAVLMCRDLIPGSLAVRLGSTMSSPPDTWFCSAPA